MDDFFTRWNLNEEAQEAFIALDPQMQQDIMTQFSPRDTSRDVNAVFHCFLKSRTMLLGANMTQRHEHHEEFFEKWSLNEKSQQILLSLPPSAQMDVMQKFQPRDITRDCNPLFICFAKGAAKFASSQGPISRGSEHCAPATPEAVQTFCDTWNLNETAVQFLASIPPKTQTDVMDNFQPRDTSRDVNNVFLSFAQSRVGAAPAGKMRGVSSVSSNELMAKWNLKPSAMLEFSKLSPEVQGLVASDFAPRDLSRDVTGCFIAFCRSRAAFNFVDKWALNSESITMFNQLSAEKQQEVLQTFSPKDTSRDVNNVFKSFLASRANGMPTPSGNAFAPAGGASRKRPLDKLAVFCEEWRLKPQNIELLERMTPDQQANVMLKFRPRDASRDCNSIFARFCSSFTGEAL